LDNINDEGEVMMALKVCLSNEAMKQGGLHGEAMG